MPRRLYPCTPTRLTTWLDCPRRYRFAYLDRPAPVKGPPRARTTMGIAAHTALAAWWSLPPGRRTPVAGRDLVLGRWTPGRFAEGGFRDPAMSVRAADRVAGWVERYLGDVDPEREPVGVERTVAVPTATLALSGRVDRIDARDVTTRSSSGGGASRTGRVDRIDARDVTTPAERELVVVDYKTGRRPPEPGEVRSNLALAVYAVAVARTLRRPCTRVELHHLPTGTVAAADHDAASLARKVAEAESVAADARAADEAFAAGRRDDDAFGPTPSALCSWCDWRRHCPEGRVAAPEVEPWAGADLG
ncbi:MAG: PD-(D/E)XK nuclease family protein [Actinomycetales bacterium]|nr:PD-(D/E)XK nuclease family protein [Actinomycetales bacterium]